MHDWFATVLAASTDPNVNATNTTNLKVALVGGLALILAAAIPYLLSRRQNEPKAAVELRQDLTRQRDKLQEKLDAANLEIDRLQALCYRHRIDPTPPQPGGTHDRS